MRYVERSLPNTVTFGGVVEAFRDLGLSRGGGRKAMARVANPPAKGDGPSVDATVKAYGHLADSLERSVGQRVLVEASLSNDRFSQLELVVHKITQLEGEGNGNREGLPA